MNHPVKEDFSKYFKKYMKNKLKVRKWYKSNKQFRELKLWGYAKENLTGDIWEDLIDEQIYEPQLDTKLKRSIW